MSKKKKLTVFILTVILILTLGIYCYFESTTLQVTNVDIKDAKLPSSFNGYKIIQISDLHNFEFGENNSKLIDIIQENSPDIVVITGDFVDSRRTDMKISLDFAQKVTQICPVYYVSGNHESRLDNYDQLKVGLENAGVTVLENQAVEIVKGNEAINLVGLQDVAFYQKTDEQKISAPANIIKENYSHIQMDSNNYTVVLSHRPDLFDTYVQLDMNLVFCGHTHGGQIRFPLIGAIFAPDQGIFPPYALGLYEKENTQMMVSGGLGGSIIPFRINNNPEVVIATLRAA